MWIRAQSEPVATARFNHVKIGGVTCTVGPDFRPLREDPLLRDGDPLHTERLLKLIGIESRHVAPPGITTLDLCEQASRDLLAGAGCGPETIDAIIFVTQTPDHPQPCNASLLHGRLGCPKSTAAFDINQGCSGWVYGLYVASCLVEAGGCRRVLLLAGDTVTQAINPRDRSAVLLFGDAGSATLVEYTETATESVFSLHSDGRGHGAISIPAGGYRAPVPHGGLPEVTDAEGNVRRADELHMNGVEVLNFTLREEPGAVRELLRLGGVTAEQVDDFVFHQANRFIVQNLALRLKLPLSKVPCGTVKRFGNQSSASIPAVLCHELADKLATGPRRIVASGFGVGLSWASCLLWLDGLKVCHLTPYRVIDRQITSPAVPGVRS